MLKLGIKESSTRRTASSSIPYVHRAILNRPESIPPTVCRVSSVLELGKLTTKPVAGGPSKICANYNPSTIIIGSTFTHSGALGKGSTILQTIFFYHGLSRALQPKLFTFALVPCRRPLRLAHALFSLWIPTLQMPSFQP